jgi:predicted permease
VRLSAGLGRLITSADEENDAPVVVLSYRLWKTAFSGREDAAGKTVLLGGRPFTIIGVLARNFVDLDLDNRPDVWLPMSAWSKENADCQIYMRLRDGVTAPQAEAELRSLYPEMIAAAFATHPDFNPRLLEQEKAMRPVLADASHGVSNLRKQFAGAVTAVMGSVGALLLLVCANVGGLMLARAETQRKEAAIRLSLGASRWSILRRILIEASLVCGAGGIAGFAIARWGGPWLMRFLPAGRPLGIELVPDLRVLAFAAAVCIFSALLMSIIPALNTFRADLSGVTTRRSARVSTPRAGRALVAIQVALATVITTGSLALVRTLNALRAQDPGFRHDARLVVVTVNPRLAGVSSDQMPGIIGEIVHRARALPNVEAVSLAGRALMRGVGFKTSAGRAGARITFPDSLNISTNSVTADYFSTMGMRILEGRGLAPGDEKRKPRPVVVTESFARMFFPGVDAIGQRFGTGPVGAVMRPDCEIVGVVRNAKYRSMRELPPPTVYSLLSDDALRSYYSAVLHVSVRGSAEPVIAELKDILRGIGPGLAPTDAATMEQEIDASLWQERLLATLSLLFAVLSGILAGTGLFGMLAYAVSRRTREIGIRIAIGATTARIARMIARDAAAAVVPGLALGLGLYAICSRVIQPLLYGVTRWDAVSIALACLALISVSVIAMLIPALRAANIAPAETLREE